jgi:hypothetical protein
LELKRWVHSGTIMIEVPEAIEMFARGSGQELYAGSKHFPTMQEHNTTQTQR